MGIAALLLTLLTASLFYLTDRQQRWLDQPLPTALRWLSGGLLVLAALLWMAALGWSLGLIVGLWALLTSLLLMSLLVGHWRDGFQKSGGRS